MAPKTADPSTAEMATGIARQRGLVDAIGVNYRKSTISWRGGKERREVMDVHVIVKGDKFYASRQLIESDFQITRQSLHDERPRLYCDGETFYKYWPHSRILHTTPLKPDATVDRPENYLDAIAFWPKGARHRTPEHDWFFLPNALQNNTYSAVQGDDGTETRNMIRLRCPSAGEPGRLDSLWLDASLGWALVRRTLEEAPHANRQDMRTDIELSNHQEVLPSMWLPRTVRISAFRRAASTGRDSAAGFVRIAVTEISVRSLTVNEDVSDDVFVPSLQPGTIIEDQTTEMKRVIPGGMELLDDVIERGAAFYQWKGLARSPTGMDLVWGASFTTGALLSVALLAVIRRIGAWRQDAATVVVRDHPL